MSDEKILGYYTHKDNLNEYVKIASDKKIAKGKLKGQTYSVYTKTVHHDEKLWKFGRGLIVFSLTFFTIGAALAVPKVREWWKEARTGDEEVDRIKYLDSSGNGKNPTAVTTHQSGQKVLQPTTTKPLQFNSPQNTGTGTTVAKPPEEKPAPKNTYGFAVLEKVAVKDRITYPSIIGLNPKEPSVNAPALIFTPEHDKYNNRMDHVMKTPLNCLSTFEEYNIRNLTGMDEQSDTGRKAFVKRIKDRFDLLDASFDLKNRLASSDYVAEVQIQDIELPWDESGIKVMLLTQEEFAKVTLEDIKSYSDRQREVMYARFAKGVTGTACPPNLTQETFAKLTLGQIRQIPLDELNRFIKTFEPSEMLQLLTEDQLCGLDIPSLSQSQFHYIYSRSSRIQKLAPPRLEQFIRRLGDKQYLLAFLTDTQIQTLNFKDDTLISKNGFSKLADMDNGYSQTATNGRGIRALTPEQVVDCLNRGLFDEKTAVHVSADHLEKIDFKEVKNLVKAGGLEVITSMVSGNKIKKLSPANLEYLLPQLKPWCLYNLDDSQVQAIDFKKKIMTKEQFYKMADWENGYTQSAKDGRGIRALTAEQVVDCLDNGLFDPKTAEKVTAEQLENIVFTKVKDLNTAGGVEVFTSMVSGQKIKKLSPANLEYLLPQLKPWCLYNLDDSQVQAIDFKKKTMTKEQFIKMADMENGYTQTAKDGRGIRALTAEQVADCLENGLFDSKTAGHVSAEQLENIDFRGVKDLKTAGGMEVLTAMVNGNKIKKLTPANLEYLLPQLKPWCLYNLDDSQVQAIDFKKRIMTKEQFIKMADMENGYTQTAKDGRGIRALTAEQVVDCLKLGLFDEKTAAFITPNQVEKANFRSIINLKTAGGASVISAMARSANIKKLSPTNLEWLLPHLNAYTLSNLDDSQIEAIDFKKGIMTKEQFIKMADMENGYTQNAKDGRGIRALKAEQVIECLRWNLFDDKTLRYLNDAKLRELDDAELAGLPKSAVVNAIILRKSKL